MNLLQIGISVFCFIEVLNITILYFMPNSKIGNGVGVFDSYHESVKDPRTSEFVKYLVNWVAGAKLIFIMVGMVVVIFGNYNTQLYTVIALIISILSFYWKLFPAIKRLDKKGEISPKGYSKTLNLMILAFIIGFVIVLVVELIN
jgi:flagellar biosynthesis protein FlhB